MRALIVAVGMVEAGVVRIKTGSIDVRFKRPIWCRIDVVEIWTFFFGDPWLASSKIGRSGTFVLD